MIGFVASTGANPLSNTFTSTTNSSIVDISTATAITGTASTFGVRTSANISGGTLSILALSTNEMGGLLINGVGAAAPVISSNIVYSPFGNTGGATSGEGIIYVSGGYTSGRKEIIELLRQRSRPYLFSNTLCPSIAGATLKVLELLTQSTALRDQLEANTQFFRHGMTELGFSIPPGTHPICPIMLGDASLATTLADAMLAKGVYVIGFSYPVVPQGKARIRTQISAAHSMDDMLLALGKFAEAKNELSI